MGIPMTHAHEVYRITAAWEKDLGRRPGRHRLACLVEDSGSDRMRHRGLEIFVDQNRVAITRATNPAGPQNDVLRRHCPPGGEFANDKPGNRAISIPTYHLAGKDDRATYPSRTTTQGLTR